MGTKKVYVRSENGFYKGIVATIAILAVFGGLLYFSGYFNSFAGTGSSVKMTGTSGGPSCPSTNQYLQLEEGYINLQQTQNNYTLAAVVGNVYTPGGVTSANTFTTATSGYVQYPSSGGAGCNQAYNLLFGDNNAFLEVYVPGINTGTRTNSYINVTALKYSAPTFSASNSPTQAFASNTVIYGVTAGTPVTSDLFTIEAGTNFAGNKHGEVVIFTYNAQGDKPILSGATQYVTPAGTQIPVPSYTNGQNAYVAYVLPQASDLEYATPSGPVTSQAAGEQSLNIQMQSTYAANTFVGTCIYPITGFVNTGTWVNNTISDSLGNPLLSGVCNSYAIELV